MDLITTHVNADFDAPGYGPINISKKMAALIPKEIMALLHDIGREANAAGYAAFVVGGFVRDVMLGRRNLDLDIVIEGEAIKLGEELSKKMKASLVVHKRFGTCSIITKDRLKIDLATARKETYERPAALPTVEFSSLKDDLIRRDFTINAMAVSINSESFGQLIDFFGGERDLSRGIIKIMHDGSFIDDPTRIFRAVKFEQRFGFRLDSHTEELITHAIKKEMFSCVEPQRIRDELVLILKEDKPIFAVKRMAELDELRFLHPKIRFGGEMPDLFKAIDDICAWYDGAHFKKRSVEKWLIYLMALFDALSYNELSSICARFVFRRSETIRLLSYKESADKAIKFLSRRERILPSRIYKLLEPLAYEVTLLIMARSSSAPAREKIRAFFERFNGSRISVKGEDIRAMGIVPGPRYKEIFDRILRAKIDGRVATREEELAYAAKLIRKKN